MIRVPPEEMFRREQVRIGELRISPDGLLTATLGSCVGIAVLCAEPRSAGLAHCLLPADSAEEPARRGARFVDSGIANLLREFESAGIERRRLRIYIAGGANLIGSTPERAARQVGHLNLTNCRRTLRELGLTFYELDTGGTTGCEIHVDAASQTVRSAPLAPAPYRSNRP